MDRKVRVHKFMLCLLQELLDEAAREKYTATIGKLPSNRVKNRNPQVVPCKGKERETERFIISHKDKDLRQKPFSV